mgnify:FL=1
MIWQVTGDTLDIDVTYPELMEHWMSNLPSHDFVIKKDNMPYDAVERLSSSIRDVNELLKSKFDIKIFDYGQVKMEQRFLNQVHRDWARLQQEHENITKIIERFNGDYLKQFYDINDAFHVIEQRCKVRYVEQGSDTEFKHQMPGISDPERFLMHGQCQLELQYWSIGRTDYDAWHAGDDVALIDNSTKLPLTFDVKLQRPFTAPYPPSYVDWMRDRGKAPVGSIMPIGNFVGYLDSVGDLYDVFIRNNTVDQRVTLTF